MSSNPYENEPGFEDAKEPHDKKNQKDYVAKVSDSRGLFQGYANTSVSRYVMKHFESRSFSEWRNI
jgi:hypothetical protein